jgi:hypothetical protein
MQIWLPIILNQELSGKQVKNMRFLGVRIGKPLDIHHYSPALFSQLMITKLPQWKKLGKSSKLVSVINMYTSRILTLLQKRSHDRR